MNTLQIATQVAAHPAMVKLRAQQEMMRRQLVNDYGDEFMLTGQDKPEIVLPNGRTYRRLMGIHFWTVAQQQAWFAIETRMRNCRTAITNAYLENAA